MSLNHYLAVVRGKQLPFWWRSKFIAVPDGFSSLPNEQLWQLHDELTKSLRTKRGENKPTQRTDESSLLDLKVELTRRIYRSCTLCPLMCRVDRLNGEVGQCRLEANAHVFREGLLVSEEPFIVPTYELFLTGCNMRCKFCQAWEGVVRADLGFELMGSKLAPKVEQKVKQGALNIHFVGGEPTVNLLAVLLSLKSLKAPLPIVWNTNLFATDEAMKLLDGVVDLFVADFKFGNEECAQAVGGVRGYVATVQSNLLKAFKIASLVIRHLVMPGHIECCLLPVVSWVAQNLPKATFHLMLNYVPEWKAWSDNRLSRRLSQSEKQTAKAIVKSMGLKRVLISE